ncbi:MAG: translation initiation factor IF-3, partial [Nocardioides sp.]
GGGGEGGEEEVTEMGFVESTTKKDGSNMVMVIGPHRKKADARLEMAAEKVTKAEARAEAEAEERAERTAHNAGHAVAAKRQRGRSENLDPEIEA